MSTRLSLILLISIAYNLVACSNAAEQKVKTSSADSGKNTEQLSKTTTAKLKEVKQTVKEDKNALIWQEGKVQFLNLEGGFFGIITKSGKKLLPMNLPKELAQNGAIVRVKGKEKDIITIQQWGTPFVITEAELITPGNPIDDDSI